MNLISARFTIACIVYRVERKRGQTKFKAVKKAIFNK